MKKKYLPLYHEWLKSGIIPNNGLCNCFGSCSAWGEWYPVKGFEDFKLMFPSESFKAARYWGADDENDPQYYCRFGSLRQTIVLFMAAMNGEL